MPYNRPPITDLITRTRNDVVSRLPDPDVLRRSNADVYARALAGAAHGLYGYIDWLSNQLIYDTADGDMLERWASIWGVSRKPATTATGQVTFTGNNGATIPAGSELMAFDGVTYETDVNAIIASGIAIVNVTALEAGIAGNRTAGQLVSLQSVVAGVTSSVTAGELTGGANIESDDALRSRLLSRIKRQPQGGARHDYESWALSVPGVTRAWVYPQELGAGTVSVRFMMDDTYPTGIPLSGDIAAVEAAIEPMRPVTANVFVSAPVAVPLNFTITGLNPSNATVKAAIEAELKDLIFREASPGGTIYLSHIREAISTSAGEVDHALTVPSANVVLNAGLISTMGTITWA